MKKQMIAIALLSAAVCLTGCTVNINDDTVSQAANIAASVLEETDITLNSQPVDASPDFSGFVQSISFKRILFAGSLATKSFSFSPESAISSNF